jgi:hypothetical protein
MIEEWFTLEEKESDFSAGVRNAARYCAVVWLIVILIVAGVWVAFH